ncbi:hypothetical protein [Niabella aurantiaca]|uniref:hypothetical protein n=1 Tax=Niabella aurantiaca TaxID=379900 RepID=UPI0003660A7D|nr:hypothetical protein [Niabella aurantiaca]
MSYGFFEILYFIRNVKALNKLIGYINESDGVIVKQGDRRAALLQRLGYVFVRQDNDGWLLEKSRLSVPKATRWKLFKLWYSKSPWLNKTLAAIVIGVIIYIIGAALYDYLKWLILK